MPPHIPTKAYAADAALQDCRTLAMSTMCYPKTEFGSADAAALDRLRCKPRQCLISSSMSMRPSQIPRNLYVIS